MSYNSRPKNNHNNHSSSANDKIIPISCQTHQGIENFLKILQEKVTKIFDSVNDQSNSIFMTETRQLNHLTQTIAYLQEFETYLEMDRVIAIEFLRLAFKELLFILGEDFEYDEILDVIFGNFCVGK